MASRLVRGDDAHKNGRIEAVQTSGKRWLFDVRRFVEGRATKKAGARIVSAVPPAAVFAALVCWTIAVGAADPAFAAALVAARHFGAP
jgi:hypothetical protein